MSKTTTLQIAANSDDADEKSDGTVTLNDSRINSTTSIGGYRFPNIPIPPGSTVTAASLEFYLSGVVYVPNARIRAQAADNASTFSTSSYNISGRTQTTAYTDWTDTDHSSGWYTTQDIAAVVQEIIDRGGWSKDNAIAFVLTRQGSGNMPIVDYNGTPSRAAKLNLTWTEPAAPHYDDAILLAAALDSTMRPSAHVGAAMTLGIETAVNNPPSAGIQGRATLARMMEVLTGGAMATGEFVNLTRTETTGAAGLADAIAAAMLTRNDAALFDAFAGADAAMQMDQERAATFAHNVDMSAAVTFLLDAAMGFRPDHFFATAMTLATARPFNMTGLAIAQATIDLINDAEIETAGDVAALVAGAIELAIERDLTANETAALQAAIALLAERAVTADASLVAGAFIELIESRAVDVDATAALWAMLTLAAYYDVDTASMAAVLEQVGFVRVGQFQATGQAGIFEVVEMVAYQAILAGGVVNALFTPRHIFIVDAEGRRFIVSRETREFKARGV